MRLPESTQRTGPQALSHKLTAVLANELSRDGAFDYNPAAMGVPPKEAKSEASSLTGRRSTRVAISIPITISGKGVTGLLIKDDTRTIAINKYGAKLATLHQVAFGAEISIEHRALARTGKAPVVWLKLWPRS